MYNLALGCVTVRGLGVQWGGSVLHGMIVQMRGSILH
jgi:hypothetical protein